MKSVFAIVQRQGVLFAIESKGAVRDAIRIAANDRTEERVGGPVEVGHVPIEIVEAQHYVGPIAAAVRNFQGNYNPAVGGDSSFIGAVAKRENLHRSSVRHLSVNTEAKTKVTSDPFGQPSAARCCTACRIPF